MRFLPLQKKEEKNNMRKNNISARSTDCTTNLSNIEVTPNEITLKISTTLDGSKTAKHIEVKMSKEDLIVSLKEMQKKSISPKFKPAIWYSSIRDVTAINNLIKRLYYTLLINENGEIKEVSEITADHLKKLVENHGSWIILPTSVETVEEEDLDYSSFEDEDLFARNKMDYLADYCYGNGVMVSYPSLTDMCPIFSYKSWNGKNIQIHNEEDADRFLRVTAIYGVPLFEESNESTLEEEAQ